MVKPRLTAPVEPSSFPGRVKESKPGRMTGSSSGLMAPEAISVPWNQLLYKELDVFGCFSSPPSSWQKALAAERDEADKLSQLVQVRPFDEWELAFDQLRHGQVVKTLLDLEA